MADRLGHLSVVRDVQVMYFGVQRQSSGHTLCIAKGQITDYVAWRKTQDVFGTIDGSLCWNGRRESGRDETEGRALLTHSNGWTVIAFWDRSGDKRFGSNSAFFVEAELTYDQLLRAAKQQWPEVWARFTFPVVQVDARGREVAC